MDSRENVALVFIVKVLMFREAKRVYGEMYTPCSLGECVVWVGMLELRIGPGRRTAEVEVQVVRPLDRADLMLLVGERGTQAKPIKAIRDRHHSVARLLAQGMTDGEVAAITGYMASRISILKSDPTFRELVEFYKRDIAAVYVDMHATLAGLSLDAALIMRERLEDNPDDISDTKLLEIIKVGADRTGLGPTTKQDVNINVNLANRLEAARKRVAQRMIDITPERKTG